MNCYNCNAPLITTTLNPYTGDIEGLCSDCLGEDPSGMTEAKWGEEIDLFLIHDGEEGEEP